MEESREHSIGTWRRLGRPSLIVAILGLGAALRFPGLGFRGFWYDEIFSVEIALQGPKAALQYGIWGDPHPPLFNCLLSFLFDLTGASEFWARVPSALAGMLLIGLLLRARGLPSPGVGVLSGLLVSLQLLQVSFSREARSYQLFSFFTTLGNVLVVEMVLAEERSAGAWARWALTAVATVWTHLLGAISVGMQVFLLAGAVLRRDEPRERRRAVTALGGIAAGLLFLVPVFAAARGIKLPWISTPEGRDFYLLPATLVWKSFVPHPASEHTALDLSVLLWILVARGLHWAWSSTPREGPERSVLLWAILFAGPLLVLYVASLLGRPLWQEKQLLFLQPSFLILVAAAAWLPRPAALRAPIAALVVLCAASSLTGLDEKWKDTDRKVAEYLLKECPPGSVIMVQPSYELVSLEWYLSRLDPSRAGPGAIRPIAYTPDGWKTRRPWGVVWYRLMYHFPGGGPEPDGPRVFKVWETVVIR